MMKKLSKQEMNIVNGGFTEGVPLRYKVSITTFDGYCSRTPGGEMIYSRYMAVQYSDGTVEYYSILGNRVYSSN